MQITVKIKNVYGNELIYPVCDKAVLFTKLTGNKTLLIDDIKRIKELGFTINIEQQTL